MEDFTIHNKSKKRPRDESIPDPCSPEPKSSRVDSVAEDPELDSVSEHPELYHVHSVSEISDSNPVESVTDTTELYRVDSADFDRVDSADPDPIQMTEEILDILEDTDIDSSIQGLDSVIKSFEEEIINPFPATESGELDYLLGASDDELGLPPAKSLDNEKPENKSTESVTSPYQNVELKEDFAFVDELPVYDSSEFGLGDDNYDGSDFSTLGGLFDYSETPEYLWQPESLTVL